MFRKLNLGWISTLLLLFVCGDSKAQSQDQPSPNIVLILADDMGIGDAQVYNPDSQIPTPHIDRLAAEGVRLTDVHSPSGVCTPTRYGLLTGRYSWRTRMKQGVLVGYSRALIEPGRPTIASVLKEHGYATAGVGKWHLGLGNEEPVDYTKPLVPGPTTVGFDYYFGIPASLDMKPYGYFENEHLVEALSDSTPDVSECCFGAFWRGGPMAPSFKHEDVLPDFTRKAVEYIDGFPGEVDSNQPFFLYVPLAAPHTPWMPTGEFVGSTEAGEYGDFTAQVDATVGQIMDALDRNGMTDETLIIFTSDNGAIWPQEKIDEFDHRANGPYRGQKADIWEGGHRVPFIARWPGRIPAGTVSDEIVSLTDMLATLTAAAGVPVPDDAGEDSYNVLPALDGTQDDTPIREATVHHSSQGVFAIRQGPWKLIEGRGSGGFTAPAQIEPGPGEPVGQLYNLEDDPAETTNLYAERPDLVEHLMAMLDRYRTNDHSLPQDDEAVILFDGESFEGWEGDLDWFRIEDEAIVAGSMEREIPQNEFLCTNDTYGDFVLTLEAKLLGDGVNAGVQIRSERIPNHNEVIGYQADLGDGWWGALYDESRRNRVLAGPDQEQMQEVVNHDDWNTYEIHADGPDIHLMFNGVETVTYTEPDDEVSRTGKICLQIHSGPPGEAWYRNVRLTMDD